LIVKFKILVKYLDFVAQYTIKYEPCVMGNRRIRD